MRPALTTRLGGAGILVSPNTCLTVTEPSSATSPGFDPHAATNAAAPAVNARKPRRDNEPGTRRE